MKRFLRTLLLLFFLITAATLAYTLWQPGLQVRDGRHDKGRNAIWMQHGWLGDDAWFTANNRNPKKPQFRSAAQIRKMAVTMRRHHVTDLYLHLCPTQGDGSIMGVDHAQTERFLNETKGLRVFPWVGGRSDKDARPADEKWRKRFIATSMALLKRHPRLAGVHLNIEPWKTGNQEMLTLLDELRAALPTGKQLSVSAYSPTPFGKPFPELSWNPQYFQEVARRVDQMAVMSYDTSIPLDKVYIWLMGRWTRQILELAATSGAAQPPQILMGAPNYDDDVIYHRPHVENLETALSGIHEGLSSYAKLPAQYQGVAIYCEWEMDEKEWGEWRGKFAGNDE